MRDLPRRCWPARLSSLASILVLLTLAACTVGPEWERFLGVIELSPLEDEGLQVDVPEEVRVGEPFDVSVVTYYGGCERQGGTEIQQVGSLRRVVTPYDERQIEFTFPNVNCPSVLRFASHTATLQFSQPGTGTVVFRGFSRVAQDTIEVERTVEVR